VRRANNQAATPPKANAGHKMRLNFSTVSSALLLWVTLLEANAQPIAPARVGQIEVVVVTATRTETPAFDVPASISRIEGNDMRDGHAQVNFSEGLGSVPGLQARERQNYAQDVQISVRGFGARSTFGIRGVRLYVDGIPATLPDGQGQITNVELSSVGRIEVLRGPFSALYGNSSGGVIQVFTEDGGSSPNVRFGVAAGSDGLLRYGAQASGAAASLNYSLSASQFHTDGYRIHSRADRTLGNVKLQLHLDDDAKLTLVANAMRLPEAQDPLGLTHAQFDANPRGVDPSALDYSTRKSVGQTQFGLIYKRRITPANALQITTYDGHRSTEQFQSIPKGTQGGPLNPGGVISLVRDYNGVDLQWSFKSKLADAPFSLVGGLAYDGLAEHRQGFQNFIGNTLGVEGALRRDERNTVSNFDQYLQASWRFAPQWTLNAGVRHSAVRFKSVDAYVNAANPDDSGGANYRATLPVLGLVYAVTDDLRLYATSGRGFETPTLNELAYRSGGGSGLNFSLQAARSSSAEAGLKWRNASIGELNAALFKTTTNSEIVTQSNTGGRSTFQNAGATRRTGAELGWSAFPADSLRAQVAATLVNATYRDAFLSCTTSPCAAPIVPIAAGNRIPGIARGSLFAALNWVPTTGLRGGIEARYVTGVFVNDLNTDVAPRYAIASANLGFMFIAGTWELGGFVRADNLFDRKYAGSVIVNEGNGRYFEPAAGRTWLTSASATLRF
jgi:iron complex outermembrane receptor protein